MLAVRRLLIKTTICFEVALSTEPAARTAYPAFVRPVLAPQATITSNLASSATWQPGPRELPCGAVQKSRRRLHCTNNDKSQASNGELMFYADSQSQRPKLLIYTRIYEPPSHRSLLRKTLNVPPCTISSRAFWSTVTADVAS